MWQCLFNRFCAVCWESAAVSDLANMPMRARIWISGALWFGKNNLLLHPHSEILCRAALPVLFPEITYAWCFAIPNSVFSNSTWTIFNGGRLHRSSLKSQCVRFLYGNKCMNSKLNKWNRTWLGILGWACEAWGTGLLRIPEEPGQPVATTWSLRRRVRTL